jgi:hypothetical protein
METSENKIISMLPNLGGQESFVLVSGELFIKDCSLFGTEVILIENDIVSQKYICCLNGFFYFKLEYEKIYTIKIVKEGFETKSIVFNTQLKGFPAKKRYYEFGVGLSSNMLVGKFDEDNIPPVAIIKYAIGSGKFEQDRYYMEQRKQNQNNLA